MLEQFFHSIEHDTGVFVVADHCISFSCTSLTIGKYCRIVPVEYTFAKEFRRIFEDFLLWSPLIEGIVECVLFFFASILSKHFLLIQDIGRIHQNDNVSI